MKRQNLNLCQRVFRVKQYRNLTDASSRLASSGRVSARSSVGGARASSGRDGEERGGDARSLARGVRSGLLFSAVALSAGTSAGGGLVGRELVGTWHLHAGSLAADIGLAAYINVSADPHLLRELAYSPSSTEPLRSKRWNWAQQSWCWMKPRTKTRWCCPGPKQRRRGRE